MIATGHLLASCLLASEIEKKKLSEPAKAATALSLGALSHLVMDAIPHFDPSFFATDPSSGYIVTWSLVWWLAVADNLVGGACILWWAWHKPVKHYWLLAMSILGCWAPDLYVYAYQSQRVNANWISQLLYDIHHNWHYWWSRWFNLSPIQTELIVARLGTPMTVVSLYWLGLRFRRELITTRVRRETVQPFAAAID